MHRLSLALMGAMLITGSGIVQAQQQPADTPRGDRARFEQRRDRVERGSHPRTRHRAIRGRRGGQPVGAFVRDLNLTQEQRTRIRAIQDRYRPQFRAMHDQSRTQLDAVRALRQRGDSAGARAALQRVRESVRQQSTTLRERQMNEIRALLTPEQRTKWDAAQARRREMLERRREQMHDRRLPMHNRRAPRVLH